MKKIMFKQLGIKLTVILGLFFVGSLVYAAEIANPLETALNNEVQSYFGAGSAFWKFFIIGDVALSTYAGIKTKSPLVFTFVLLTAFIPGILLKAFVFKAVA